MLIGAVETNFDALYYSHVNGHVDTDFMFRNQLFRFGLRKSAAFEVFSVNYCGLLRPISNQMI